MEIKVGSSFKKSLENLLDEKISYCEKNQFDATPIIESLKVKLFEIQTHLSSFPFEGKSIAKINFHRRLIFEDKGSDYSLIYQIFPMTALESENVDYIGLSDIFSNQTNWSSRIEKVLSVDDFL